MTKHILIDQSHGQAIRVFPDQILPKEDVFIQFVSPTDDLTRVDVLQKQDLIIIADPKPENRLNALFSEKEITLLKKYVKAGGKILITSSNHGDYNISSSKGSLRALKNISHVIKYEDGFIFHQDPVYFIDNERNLRIHPNNSSIFSMLKNSSLNIHVCNSTILKTTHKQNILLFSPKNTILHSNPNKKNIRVNRQPLIVESLVGDMGGMVITCAFSNFLYPNGFGGYKGVEGNALLSGILSYMNGDG